MSSFISVFKETRSIFLSKLGRNSLKLLPTTPGKDSAFSLIFSISLNSLSHLAAVFCPTFGTPGMLSDESPTSANISLICVGLTPNFSKTFSSLKVLWVMVFIKVVSGSLTSCIRSLSRLETTHLKSLSLATVTKVAITSSASTPSTSSSGKPIALQISFTGFNCSLKSSGIGGRFDLYSSKISCLKFLPLASKTTTIGEPSLSFFKFISMFVTPFTAPVGLPLEVVNGGIA